jgi:type II secretory pathway pseudopilin PulG
MKRQSRGFTMLALMVVAFGLATLGSPRYQLSVLAAKESAFKQDEIVVCNAIEQYTLDKHQIPRSLEDLVAAGYLYEIPTNPLTHRSFVQVGPCKK